MQYQGMQLQAAHILTASEQPSGLGIPHWVLPSKNSPKLHNPIFVESSWPRIVLGEYDVPLPNALSPSPCDPGSPFHIPVDVVIDCS